MRDKLFFALTLSWLIFLFFMDFIAAPTIIQSDIPLFSAGEIAGSLFVKFNYFESSLGLSLLLLVARAKSKLFLAIVIVLFIIPLIDIIYLSPKILYYAELMQKADVAGDSNEQHYLFHTAYFVLELVKICGLFALVGMTVFKDIRKEREL